MDFSHFSFAGPSTHAAEPVQDVSPTTTTQLPPLPERLPTPPSCSMAHLAHILDQQSLRIAVPPAWKPVSEPLTPPDDAVLPFATAPAEPRPQLSLSTARLNSATLRMQRQANVRMQSSAAHIKDISTLVERMVETGDQCTVCDPKPATPPSPTSDDEGISMEYNVSNPKLEFRSIPYYRAGDRVEGYARVTKHARMRRRPRTSASKDKTSR